VLISEAVAPLVAWSRVSYVFDMADRDVEKAQSRDHFVATLRRLADAIERAEPFRIQVAAQRFVVPANAELSIEHEVEGDQEELELQLRWSR
jgi:amphi-Trp domain-containing protein